MNIGARLEAIGRLVPENVSIADIGTDHAYLPAWLAERGRIKKAVAGDICEGPCAAARNTVAMYGLNDKIEVRMGNGLAIIRPGETDVIIIAGMGAGTMIEIIEAGMEAARAASLLILQPMAGAPSLRRWANAHGWYIADEVLVEEGRHLYEIIVLKRGHEAAVSTAAYEIGPRLLEQRPPLFQKHLAKICGQYQKMLLNMQRSAAAKQSGKYQEIQALVQELEGLDDGGYGK